MFGISGRGCGSLASLVARATRAVFLLCSGPALDYPVPEDASVGMSWNLKVVYYVVFERRLATRDKPFPRNFLVSCGHHGCVCIFVGPRGHGAPSLGMTPLPRTLPLAVILVAVLLADE